MFDAPFFAFFCAALSLAYMQVINMHGISVVFLFEMRVLCRPVWLLFLISQIYREYLRLGVSWIALNRS